MSTTEDPISVDELKDLLFHLVPEVEWLWNPRSPVWKREHITVLSEVLATQGIYIRISVATSSSGTDQAVHAESYTCVPRSRSSYDLRCDPNGEYEPASSSPTEFLDIYYEPTVGSQVGHYSGIAPDLLKGVELREPEDINTTSKYGDWAGAGGRDRKRKALPDLSASANLVRPPTQRLRQSGNQPQQQRPQRQPTQPQATTASGTPVSQGTRSSKCSDGNCSIVSPSSSASHPLSPVDLTVEIPCFIKGCSHRASDPSNARAHANNGHHGEEAPPNSNWLTLTRSGKCPTCNKYFSVSKQGKVHSHTCRPMTGSNARNARMLNATTLQIPGTGTFSTVECGATIRLPDGKSLVNRCFFLALARAIRPAETDAQQSAKELQDAAIARLQTDQNLRAKVSASLPTNRAVVTRAGDHHATSIEHLIEQFNIGGMADNFIIQAASVAAARIIEIWEIASQGNITVKVIFPDESGPPPAITQPLRLWRISQGQEHYQMLQEQPMPQPRDKRPLPPELLPLPTPENTMQAQRAQTPQPRPQLEHVRQMQNAAQAPAQTPARQKQTPARRQSATPTRQTGNAAGQPQAPTPAHQNVTPARRQIQTPARQMQNATTPARPPPADMHNRPNTTVKQRVLTAARWFTEYGKASATIIDRRRLAQNILSLMTTLRTVPFTDLQGQNEQFREEEGPYVPPPPKSMDEFHRSIASAVKELRMGHVSRAMNHLLSAGILMLTPDTIQQLDSKYPKGPRDSPVPPKADDDTSHETEEADLGNQISISSEDIIALIKSKSPLTGAGNDGWSYRLLQDLLKQLRVNSTVNEAESLRGLHQFILDIANGRLDTVSLRPLFTTLRGVALRKNANSEDVRPIGIGQVFTSIAATLTVRNLTDAEVHEGVGPTDWMHRTAGGVEAINHFTRAYSLRNPTHAIAKTDVSNAFGSISRDDIMQAANIYPKLIPLATMLYGTTNNVIFSDSITSATISSEMGVTQGDPLAALLYSTALKKAIDATASAHPNVTIKGIADDRLFFGNPEDVLLALRTYEQELAKSGQKLQRHKTKIYFSQLNEIMTARFMQHGYTTAPGLVVGGSPVGDTQFVQAWLSDFVDGIQSRCDKIKQLHGVQKLTGARTQDMYRIIRWCLTPASVNHLLRTVPPHMMQMAAVRFDAIIYDLFLYILGQDPNSPLVNTATPEGDLTAARVRLAAAAGGLGITSAAEISVAAYLGSLCLTAHLAKQVLNEEDAVDPPKISETFPFLAQAVTANMFAEIPTLKDLSLLDLTSRTHAHVQRKLSRGMTKAKFLAVANRITDPSSKAWLLSGQDDGATFLISYPQYGGGLSDAQWVTLVKARAGLTVVESYVRDALCPLCTGLKCGRGTLSTAMTTIHRQGLHALTCTVKGTPEGSKVSWRHAILKYAVIAFLKAFGCKSSINLDVEPTITNHYPFRPNFTEADAIRGDIACTLNGLTYIIDTTIVHPNAARNPQFAAVPGLAADIAHNAKETSYNKIYDIPVGQLVPLAAETGGRLHPSFQKFVAKVIKSGLTPDASPEPAQWTPALRALYGSRLRAAFTAINIAIARSVATTLLRGSTVLKRFPAPNVAPPPLNADNVFPPDVVMAGAEDNMDTQPDVATATQGVDMFCN